MDMNDIIRQARETDQSFRKTQMCEHVSVIVNRIAERIEDDILLFIFNNKELQITYDVPKTPSGLSHLEISQQITESLKTSLNISLTVRYIDPTTLKVVINV